MIIENGDVTALFLKFRHEILGVVIKREGIKIGKKYSYNIASGRGKKGLIPAQRTFRVCCAINHKARQLLHAYLWLNRIRVSTFYEYVIKVVTTSIF